MPFPELSLIVFCLTADKNAIPSGNMKDAVELLTYSCNFAKVEMSLCNRNSTPTF